MLYPCFSHKVALITGGTRGIGRRIAELLADSGTNLALVYRRDTESADATQKDIEKTGRAVLTIKADLSKEESIPDVIAEVRQRFDRLDYLVSNAVFGVLKPIGEFTAKRFDISMNANARAFLLLAQAASDLMVPPGSVDDSWERPAGGLRALDKRIVALSSLGSTKVIPGYAAVGASKAAIESLTRYLAAELAWRGIGVNAVSGGLVETDSIKAFSDQTEWVESQIKKTPLGRIGEPNDIAKVVVWLLTDQAEWITGQTIIADGGLSLI
jgi:enoyl-[acyl-carrier protein] reductase III